MADSNLLVAAPSALGLMYWGRKSLDLPTRLPAWDRWLQQLWKPVAAIVALGLLGGGAVADWLDDAFWAGMLALGVAVGWRLRASYQPALWVGLGLAPVAAYYLADALLKLAGLSMEKNVSQHDNLEAIWFFWLLACFQIARSQRKNLAADAQRRAAAQEEQRAVESQNQTLEYEVSQRTAALTQQTDELRATLLELQETQSQLVQREKMASLGELTAGIAHEIQNPLNFVNNFADVSAELVAELEDERARPERDAGLETELLADLRQNLQRISQHGQRASGIVRGMLEHSRAGSGERQPVSVNALCDEYLRLAYHGLRAKNKTFNATLQTDFAPDVPPVEAVPGDLGRMLLNLINNAFYAVQKRQQAGGEPTYVPTVRVQTRLVGEQVEIRVADNGTGMTPEVQQQIFQPFFTTKPSGEGTGLGLSLSYDIITKGHGGTLAVESQEGKGTEFCITLPA